MSKFDSQRLTLPEVLISATAIGAGVSDALKTSESITSLGVEIMSVAVISIKPTPEMAKALEAGAREALQRKSDEAIYARRNAAVEQERRIKEEPATPNLASSADATEADSSFNTRNSKP